MFEIHTTTEHIQSTAGLALAGEIAAKIGLLGYTTQDKRVLRHPEILSSLFGIYIQGRSRYEEINLFLHDELLKRYSRVSPAKHQDPKNAGTDKV
ncbi:MAG: hypothetical protein ACLFSA_09600 [Spirochaetaceae bacterium]